MLTELKVVERVIEGGRQIQCYKDRLSNYNLHQCAIAITNCILGAIECDSANSVAQLSTEDAKMLRLAWDNVKGEFEIAKSLRDLPSGKLEREFFVLCVTDNELLSVGNAKVKRICDALDRLLRSIVNSDSASMQDFIGAPSESKIQKVINMVDAVMDRYVGSGADYMNTGIEMPEYRFGQLNPDSDLDAVSLREPSSAMPGSSQDSPDLPSVAPLPGQVAPSK